MPNVTLSIDQNLLTRGRELAKARGMSLNSLIRQLLDETTATSSDAMDEMRKCLRETKGNSRGWKFDRDELHRY